MSNENRLRIVSILLIAVSILMSNTILSLSEVNLSLMNSNQLITFDSVPSQTTVQLNESDLENFLDEAIPEYMNQRNVAGIVISVVKENEVLFSSGYGYANVPQEIPATADTLFCIASISKSFTATAIMTLAENGTLDLDEDISSYLQSFQVPLLENSDPITLSHLLTHTAGFEESSDQVFYTSYSSMPTMGAFLRRNMPAQVHPVGYIQSYSNLGAALAGFIIQEVTGIPYEEYLEEYVLNPLGLSSTTAYQQIPDSIDEYYSRGYSGLGVEKPHYYCVVPPTGGMASTANDMAKFMMMQLNEGYYEDHQFLTEESILAMQNENFKGHPDLPGIGYGLYSTFNNNHSIVYHTGGMPTFSSIMALLPEHEVGIFISINTDSGDYDDIFDMFMDRYFPAPLDPLHDPEPIAPEQLENFEGFYLPTRREYVGLSDSLISIYGNIITQIVAISDNSLGVYSNYLPIDGMRFVHVGNSVFQDKSGLTDIMIGFREDERGTYMFLSIAAATAMEKLQSWYLDVTGPESVDFNRSESSYQIYWTISAADWQSSTYTIYCNGVNVSSSYWTPARGITFDMSMYWSGTYNLTIMLKDVLENVVTHTITVNIIPKPEDTIIITMEIIAGILFLISIVIILREVRLRHLAK